MAMITPAMMGGYAGTSTTPTNAATQITNKSPSSDSSAYGSIAKDRTASGTNLTPNYHISVNTVPSVPKSDTSAFYSLNKDRQKSGLPLVTNKDTLSNIPKANTKTNVGKLIGGTVVQGADQFVKGLTSTADMLLGGAAQEVHNLLNQTADTLGYSGDKNLFGDKNYISRFNDYVHNYSKANEEYYAKNAEGSKAAQAVNTYGTQVMAAVPAALMAVMTSGLSAAGTATTEGLVAASTIGESSGAAQFANMAGNAIKQIAANPNTQLSFAQEAGNAYESALADGATESEAAVYASIYGMAASLVEVGGGDDALGGMQKLPVKVQEALKSGNKGVVLDWAKSIVGEMGEEVVQGMLERGLKSMYTDVPIYSNTNQNALINPSVMGEEAKSAAIVSSILGGGQIALSKAINGKSNTPTDTKTNEAINIADTNNVKTDVEEAPAFVPTEVPTKKNSVLDIFKKKADVNATLNPDTDLNAKKGIGRDIAHDIIAYGEVDGPVYANGKMVGRVLDEIGDTIIVGLDNYGRVEYDTNTDTFKVLSLDPTLDSWQINTDTEIAPKIEPQTDVQTNPTTDTSVAENPLTEQPRQFTEEPVEIVTEEEPTEAPEPPKPTNPAVEITRPKAQPTADEDTFSMMRPPVNEDIVSTEKKAQSHSIEGVADARGFKYEGHTYMTRPEVESLNMAAKRVSKDMPGEISRLGNKDAWTGVDVDTAMTIANGLFDDIAKTGDSKAFDSWMKVLENHKTTSGQALQAYAKWVRSPLGKLELIKRKAAYISSQTTTKKDPKGVKAGAASQVATDITNAVNDVTSQVGTEITQGSETVAKKLKGSITDESKLRSAMREIGTTLTELAKSDTDTRQNAYDAVSNLLIDKYGLSAADASDVVSQIQERMTQLVNERADSILQNKYGAKPTEKAKATFKEKLTEAVNLGAFDSQFAEQATKSLFGIEGITIDQNLIDEYAMQTTDEGRDEVIAKMKQNIADQTPSTLMDKFNSLRYMNMLGNVKTFKNNYLGNAIGFGQRKVKDSVKSIIEAGASIFDKNTERTSSIIHGRKRYNAALQDYRNSTDVQETLSSNKKYGDAWDNIPQDINEMRTIWKFGDNPVTRALGLQNKQTLVHKGLEKWGDIIDSVMNGKVLGDAFWSSRNYADSLAGWMKANNITPAQWQNMVESGDERVDVAREYAIKQAKEATFRDRNALSEFASNFDRNWDKDGNAVGTAMKTVTKGIAPFRATPANVLARMEEYSPLGIANTVVDGVKAIKGTGEANQFIESLAKTLTGSGLVMAGFLAAKAGLARTKDDDDKMEKLNSLEGNQDYSLKIGDTTYSLDQFSPANVEFFLGVELNKMMADEKITGEEVIDFISTMSNVLIQSSMLKGVNDTLTLSKKYDDDSNGLTQVLLNSVLSYVTQGLSPTLYKQFRQFANENRQTYVSDSESLIPKVAQDQFNKAFGTNSVDYIDAWGRKQNNGNNLGERGFNAFLGSTYPSQIDDKTKAVNDVLRDIYANTKDTDGYVNIIPSVPSRNTEINGTKLSNEEYETYATTLGQTKFSLYEKAINTDGFKDLPYEEQAKILGDLSSYAKGIAENAVANSRGEVYENDTDKLLYGTDGKATVSIKNLPDYIMAKDTFSYANSDDVKDYNLIADTISNYENLPEDVQTALMERDSGYKKAYEYANGRNIRGKEKMPGVGLEKLPAFMQTMDSFNEAEKSDDYSAIDKIVASVGNDDVSKALQKWNGTIAKYKTYAKGGIGSKLYNNAKAYMGEAQELDDSTSDGSKEKFHGLVLMAKNNDISDEELDKLINFSVTDDNGKETTYLSQSWRNAYKIMTGNGYDLEQTYNFYVDSDYSLTQDEESGEYTIGKSDGKLGPYEVGSALFRNNKLTEAEKEKIFNDFVESTGNAGRYDNWSRNTGKNKWEKYSYSFIKYVFNRYEDSAEKYGYHKFTLPSNAALNISGNPAIPSISSGGRFGIITPEMMMR